MKKTIGILTGILLLVTASGFLWAKEKVSIAVLPFSVRSAATDNIDYMQDGIWDILFSRLASDDRIDVISKDVIQEELKDTGKKYLKVNDLYNIGRKLKADYLIGGNIVKIGRNLSIDGKLIDVAAEKQSAAISTQCKDIDEVIPKINDFTETVRAEITKIVQPAKVSMPPSPLVAGSSKSVQEAPPALSNDIKELIRAEVAKMLQTSQASTPPSSPASSEIIKSPLAKEAALNPAFLTSPQAYGVKGFWVSEKIPGILRGMDIGDVNNDGLNEMVVIDKHNLSIYQLKDAKLHLLQKNPGGKSDNYLAVDVADINNNGTPEIIVTNVVRDQLRSFVIEFKGGKFGKIAADVPWLLRVIHSSTRKNMLLGQQLSINGTFYSPIYEMAWNGKQYFPGKKINIPEGFSIYGLTVDRLEPNGKEKIIALDSRDFICLFEDTGKPFEKLNELGVSKDTLWKSDDIFGGSSTYFEIPSIQVADSAKSIFINLRILTYDTNKDGKNEVIIAKNLSPLGSVLRSVSVFTSSEIYDLIWDGLGLSENWKTKKIGAYLADYQIKDINNNGKDELVAALVTSSDTFTEGQSAIVVYDLFVP